MLVALNTELRDMDGTVILDQKSNPATIKGVCIEALLATYKDEENLSGEDKLKRWQLAIKVKDGDSPCDLTVEEVSLIKKLIGKAYGPLVTGQVWTILESRPPLTVVKE
jgi:hypothetical protein